MIEVLERAARLHRETGGAFDITARPLIERWRAARGAGGLPPEAEIEALRAESSWADLSLSATGARKGRESVRVDVDGIAKGFAIDRALAALESGGALGGMVEVGGDLAVFGRAPADGGWRIGIRSPFAERVSGQIRVSTGAVCTSGGYARYTEIDGKRYSHILDPRTGMPVEKVASVTCGSGGSISKTAISTSKFTSTTGTFGSSGYSSRVIFGISSGSQLV